MLDTNSLADRLAAHRLLTEVPRPQLEWLAERSQLRSFPVGHVTYREGDVIPFLQVVLTGHLLLRSGPLSGSRKLAEWRGGDITGVLPYSRMGRAPGTVTVMEPTEMTTLDRDQFRDLIANCYELTQVLVHTMVDRARHFQSNQLHDEKMRSLGHLSARLTHELNNPASAVARSASSLETCLASFDLAAQQLGALQIPGEQLASIARVLYGVEPRPQPVAPMTRAAREDAVTDWLEDHRIGDEDVAALVDTSVGVEELEALAAAVDAAVLPIVLRYAGAMLNGRRLAAEIESAASRIHGLVSAVKRFTYMDQTDVPGTVNVAQGLADTVLMLGAKARSKSVELNLNADAALPQIDGFGGELNQVWLNLIDNAIDAAPDAGHVTVSASPDGNRSIVVRVADDGPGVPKDIRQRIFEPFFTTKPVGVGTGLGLDVARRLIERHGGEIDVEDCEGGAVFRVTLPTAWKGEGPAAQR